MLAAEACARVALVRADRADARFLLDQAWTEIEGYDAGLVRWRLPSVEALLADMLGDAGLPIDIADRVRRR